MQTAQVSGLAQELSEQLAPWRDAVWELSSAVAAGGEVVIDLDATLITAHPEKEHATPNLKRGFGFHPMMAFVDHGPGGAGEPLAAMPSLGRATASAAAGQIAVLDAALAQVSEALRSQSWCAGTPAPVLKGSSGTSTAWACRTRSVSMAATATAPRSPS